VVKPSHSVFDSEIKYVVVTVQIKVIEQYSLWGIQWRGTGGCKTGITGGGRCMGGERRGGKQEKKRKHYATLCNILQSKNAKRREPTNTGRV